MTKPNKFQQFIDLGMMDQLLVIIPADGVISPDSSLNQSDAGKQPGIYDHNTGTWTGSPGWSMRTTTFDDIQLWSTWPGDLVGCLSRQYPMFDNDIDDPAIAQKVENVLQTFVPGTAKRTRVGSSRTMTYLKLADGEYIQGKRRGILKDNLGAVELLWGGQQSVLCGTHNSGSMQTFTGTPVIVTAAQIDIIWDQILSVLGDLVLKVTKAGSHDIANRQGGNVEYVAEDEATINQVKEYISNIDGAGEGERDDSAYKMVAHIRENYGIPPEIITQLMPEWGDRCDPPFPMSEIQPRINSVYSGCAQSAQGSGNVNAIFDASTPTPDYVLSEPPAIPENKQPLRPPAPMSPTGIYKFDQEIGLGEWHSAQVNSRGEPYPTLENFEIMLKCYQINIIYDVISKNVIIRGPGLNYNSDISDNAHYGQIVALCELNKIKSGIIDSYLNIMMVKNEQNPVEMWIHSKQWDGIDRIDELFNTLILEPEQNRDVAYMMFRKWLIGAVKIVQRKIDSFESVLVLQEEKGGKGKTRWFKKLAPSEWVKDGVRLDPKDKDTIKQAIGYWHVELGELDSLFRRSEIKHMMSFLSNSEDEIRLPYGKTYNKYARRTAFFGTVNPKTFLMDDSGDRRFWPIAVKGVNYEHTIDMQQLWAQVDTLDERHWLNDEENDLITEHNQEFKAPDPIDEMLELYFSGTSIETIQTDDLGNQLFDQFNRPIMVPAPMVHLSCTEILQSAGIQFPTRTHLNKGGAWLRKNYTAYKKHGKAGYWVKAMVGKL